MPAQNFDVPLVAGIHQRPGPSSYSYGGAIIPGRGVLPISPGATGFINLLAEDGGLVGRSGLSGTSTFSTEGKAGLAVGGVHYWATSSEFAQNTTYLGTIIHGANVTMAAAAIAGPFPIMLIVANDGPLFIAYTYVGGSYLTLTDTFFATLKFTSNCACLDGTFYIMDVTGVIYGSKTINDPTVWDATNSITAWNEPSTPTGVVAYKTYLLAFKQEGLDFFQDAGNALGSPLLPLLYLHSNYGCDSYATIKPVGTDLFWVGRMAGGMRTVCRLRNTEVMNIGDPDVMRAIATNTYTVASSITFFGHLCYVLGTPLYPTVLIFDTVTNLWSWLSIPRNFGVPVCSLLGGVVDVTSSSTVLTSGGTLVEVNDSYFVDTFLNGGVRTSHPIVTEIITEKITCGTSTTKVCEVLTIMCDRAGTGYVEVCWSDDDMVSWSTWQRIEMSDPALELRDLGCFVQRHFRFRHNLVTAVRIQAASITCRVAST